MDNKLFRTSVLIEFGANASETEELLAYNQNVFEHNIIDIKLPPKEAHILAWREYIASAQEIGVFESLKQRLVQLQFPIIEGISQTEAYKSATRKGVLLEDTIKSPGLLQQPDKLQLVMHESLAGAIPVLIASGRPDFVSLVQALTMHNEPKPIPDSMGACMVAGFNNWDRVYRYKKQWSTEHPNDCSEDKWAVEFAQLLAKKELYQDKFIILSDGYYSAVSPRDIGVEESEWRSLSMKIRLEHECTHYFTRRLFGSMRNNLLDELIADYRGIVCAIGHYRSDWFLRFLGLENSDFCRETGRLHNYRGKPPLSEGAFIILTKLVKAAAVNLEQFDTENSVYLKQPNAQALMLIALTCLTIEELASPFSKQIIQTNIDKLFSV